MYIEQQIFLGLKDIADSIRYFADRAYPSKIPRPKPFTIKLISERRENDMDILIYEADLPAVPEGTDVQEQELTITVDGVARDPQNIPLESAVATFEVPQDSEVSLSLVYVDDGGNRSAAREQTFTAIDTIAPDAPGDFGEIRLTGERREE